MHRLKSVYAMRFHLRHLTSGHLFKRPYDSRPILTEDHLYRSCGYTLEKPGRDTASSSRAEDWEWSSFRTSARLAPRRAATSPVSRSTGLLQLDAAPDRLDVLRAYVRENGADPR